MSGVSMCARSKFGPVRVISLHFPPMACKIERDVVLLEYGSERRPVYNAPNAYRTGGLVPTQFHAV